LIPIWLARRISGKRLLKFQHEERFREMLLRFKEGTVLEVMVRKARKPRTLPQNRYYWGVIVEMLANHTGYTKEEMHDALKTEFLSFTDHETGLTITRSTTELSTIEFRDYCDGIQRWAADKLGFVIPDPPSAIDWSSNEMEM
jgi:hypothetical protein